MARGQLDPGRFARLDRSQRRHAARALCSFPALITARDDGDVAKCGCNHRVRQSIARALIVSRGTFLFAIGPMDIYADVPLTLGPAYALDAKLTV